MKMPTDALSREIARSGVISFARFMELALYCPKTGYYETLKDRVGPAGDFITSVSTGSLFGELLAFQFAAWLETEVQGATSKVQIIEAGAHDGKLAADILNWLKNFRPELFAGIEYRILEPSPTRQAWQRETVKDFPDVRWFTGFEALKLQTQDAKLTGLLFSNELLDAFPVRRLGWDAREKHWFEWGVSRVEDKFVWARLAPAALPASLHDLPSALLDVLPDGYILEDSPAAENWWRAAAEILAHGRLLTLDYGYTAAEQFSPARLHGTLRAYQRHRVSDDLLAHPGEQDLTAHVNFFALQQAGEAAGLRTEQFCSQPQFLTRVLQQAAADQAFADWNPGRVRQFQTLTHPEHLGRAFRVLVQAR